MKYLRYVIACFMLVISTSLARADSVTLMSFPYDGGIYPFGGNGGINAVGEVFTVPTQANVLSSFSAYVGAGYGAATQPPPPNQSFDDWFVVRIAEWNGLSNGVGSILYTSPLERPTPNTGDDYFTLSGLNIALDPTKQYIALFDSTGQDKLNNYAEVGGTNPAGGIRSSPYALGDVYTYGSINSAWTGSNWSTNGDEFTNMAVTIVVSTPAPSPLLSIPLLLVAIPSVYGVARRMRRHFMASSVLP